MTADVHRESTLHSGEVTLILAAINAGREDTRELDRKFEEHRRDVAERFDQGTKKMDAQEAIIRSLVERETERNGDVKKLVADYYARKQERVEIQKFTEGRQSITSKFRAVVVDVVKEAKKPVLYALLVVPVAFGWPLLTQAGSLIAAAFGVWMPW